MFSVIALIGRFAIGGNHGWRKLNEVRRFNVELRREEEPDVPAVLRLAPDIYALVGLAFRLRSYVLREPQRRRCVWGCIDHRICTFL
jgi:nitric oxide reductase activation protein